MTTLTNQRRLAEASAQFERATDDVVRALYALEAERMSRRMGDGAEEARWHQLRRRLCAAASRCMECINGPAEVRCGSEVVEGCGATYCAVDAQRLGQCLECGRRWQP